MNIKQARQLVYARSHGICEKCSSSRATDWHHRQNRSQGGKWTPSNGLHLCTLCHRFITENPDDAYSHGWSVRGSMNPAHMPAYLATSSGRVWMYLHDDGTASLADTSGLEALLFTDLKGIA